MARRKKESLITPHTALLGLILLAALALYLRFFNSLAVPNPDFFEYRGYALSFLQLSLPDGFKRFPLFPLLIGIVSLVMPGSEPELMAALTLNLVLAVVSLWLIYRITRQFVAPSTSLAIVTLCIVNRAMVYSVSEAMSEITILTTILLVIHLGLRKSPWAYVAAFAASLTRFEAAMLIPLLVLQDRLTTTGARKTRSLVWGALASLGIVGWMVLSLQARESAYLSEMLARPSEGLVFLKGLLRVPWDFILGHFFGMAAVRRVVFLAGIVLMGTGAVVLLRRHQNRMILILGNLATYTAIHLAFPAHVDRYIVPVLWILYLLMAVSVEWLIGRLGTVWQARLRWVAASVVCIMAGFGLSSTVRYMTHDDVRLHRIQFRRVGEWYRTAAQPGDRMAVQLKSTVRYYSGLPENYFLRSKALESETPEALVDEMRAKGLTYVVWDNNPDPTGFYAKWHKTWLLSLVKARTPAELKPVLHINEAGKEAVVYRLRSSQTKPNTP